jgi:hypothetical protein
MTWLLVLAAGLIPCLYLPGVTREDRAWTRDVWLRGLLLLGVPVLAWWEPWLAPLALYVAIRWDRLEVTILSPRGHAGVGSVVTWAAIGVTWWLALSLPASGWWLVVLLWGVVAWGQAVLMVVQWWHYGLEPRGTLGQRTLAGGLFALTIPLLPAWATIGPLVGLYLSGPSWVAVAALCAAPVVLWPLWGALGVSAAIALVAVLWLLPGRILEHTPRGDSLDGLRVRGRLLRLAWRDWRRDRTWLWGTGPERMQRVTWGWQARGHEIDPFSVLHCEPAQMASDYGVLGVAAMALFAWRVGSHLQWGDPWSAAAVAGGVLCLGTFPCRVAPVGLVWLCICAKVVSA